MQRNVTIRLDEAIIKVAKHMALEGNQSLSKWVAMLIKSKIEIDDRYKKARRNALKRLSKGWDLGGKPLARDEIYDR